METKARNRVLWLVALPRPVRKAIVIGLDFAIGMFAVWLAYWLRLGEWELYSRRVIIFASVAGLSWTSVAIATRTYRSVTRFSGRHTVFMLGRSCVLLSLMLAFVLLTARFDSVPRTLAVIFPLVFFLGLVAARVAIANLIFDAANSGGHPSVRKRVLIYGAGWAGQQLDASMRKDAACRVIGFIDESRALQDGVIEGKPVWHPDDLDKVLVMELIDEVFIAIPLLKRSARRTIVERISRCKNRVRVRVLPTLSQIASGRVSVSDLRAVEIEELLGRDEVPAIEELMSRDITGRRVLVTGAGGSIGSELCRQIVRQCPACLILAEQSEHALYEIDFELRDFIAREGLGCDMKTELVNVADARQCEQLFDRWRPNTVYHAAAYKHVPLVETNPASGIRNNVLGTLNTSFGAERAGVDKFILVSTDKAVRPTNVMGASKRLCELIVQARAERQSQTSYSGVRFGNVLGSSGSVIPRFREQIAAGGPVTITHRDATRYFMTIPEASQLVIQAGALADPGDILLLDMGQPVRILDLARLMIELTGLAVADDDNPDGDIAIEEVGLRPGEKLVEELLIGAASEKTAHPRIIKAREDMRSWEELEPQLAELKLLLDRADTIGALRILKMLVPEFRCSIEHRDDGAGEARRLKLVAKDLVRGG
jgi:FlaA1/EpsC-like NDP-sugar epimerase